MWSSKFDRCQFCGTTEVKHRARGLCVTCYNFYNEGRQKAHPRLRGTAGKILTRDYLERVYQVEGRSLGDIARDCQCTRQYVYKRLAEYGIPVRGKSPARRLALQRQKLKFERKSEIGRSRLVTLQEHHINENFFSSWSPEMAYVLGVIYSDGNLEPGSARDPSRKSGKSTKVEISQKEPELLLKVQALMDSDAPLYYSRTREYEGIRASEIYRLAISNEKIFDDLLSLGLTPAKSKTLTFPKIPQECVRHFIRGCWDGDGAVYFEEENIYKIRASYVSGSVEFLKTMLTELEKAGFSKRTIHKDRRSSAYYFYFVGIECEKLFHYFYDAVRPECFLGRKYERFKEYTDLLDGLRTILSKDIPTTTTARRIAAVPWQLLLSLHQKQK